mmetsp:Transcript_29027/g.69360  ORF Transcript_29027/g.69360 Transcript_29027/m.69360 type:complete len:335 (+) Transcript_29027:275-1279(+)
MHCATERFISLPRPSSPRKLSGLPTGKLWIAVRRDPLVFNRRSGRVVNASAPIQTAQQHVGSSLQPKGGSNAQKLSLVTRAASDTSQDFIDVAPEPDAASYEGIKAFVAGASGRTGREIVKALVARGVRVRAMARDTNEAAKLLPGLDQGVEVVKGDVFKFQTLPGAISDCNVVLCATGSASLADPFGPYSVDYQGTKNLVAAAKQAGVKRFVFVSSIGADDVFFPLNLAWGVLFWKKRAEEEIQRSGITYTVVRPGGLLDEPRGEQAGNVVMKGADSFGLPLRSQPGSILRSQVADCCVQALVLPSAAGKVVEVIASNSAPLRSVEELYRSVD